MFANLQRIFSFHIKDNIKYYIFVLCGFICGGIIAAACVFGLSEIDFKELSVYFKDFFQGMADKGFNSYEIFRLSVEQNLKFFIILSVVSMMIIGALFVPLFSALYGYSFCFTLFYILKAYGFEGMLLFFTAIFPHQIIFFPCILVSLVTSMSFSVSLTKERGEIRAKAMKYIIKMVALFFISVLASLLQGYIEPVLINIVAPLFLK